MQNCPNGFTGMDYSIGTSIERQKHSKLYHDPVHGTIKLDPLLVSIIDTPQYQRLRNIKQLGMVYLVYPGASHNRFEHGIGTSYLCGLMLKTLKDLHENEYKDDIEITKKDILCVQVAGLCHDLGHGPFSHTFERYMDRYHPTSHWRHEDTSCSILDYLLSENEDVRENFRQRDINQEEIDLIKRMIQGRNPDTIPEVTEYHGESFKKCFLYEIVANKRTGIDCDKFDYFARDSHQVGVKNSFDFNRFFQNIRILGVNGQLQICVRDKEVLNLYEIFHVRWKLHYYVYQHKTTKVIEDMIFKVLSKVDGKFGISSSVTNMDDFMWMTDSILLEILRSKDTDSSVQEAKAILKRLHKRELYLFCGEINACNTKMNKGKHNVDAILNEITQMDANLSTSDLFVDITKIGIGMKDKDPINNVIFYSKYGKVTQKASQNVSKILPQIFEEEYIRVWSRESSKSKIVEAAFSAWCDKNRYADANVEEEKT